MSKYSRLKFNIDISNYFLLRFFLKIFLFYFAVFYVNQVLTETKDSELNNKISYSFFGETGETESSFTIAGRNFPVKVGSVGLKATITPIRSVEIYTRLGIGYSPKQTVSAYNFNVSGSVFATSIGAGANWKYRIRRSDFIIVPFTDFNYYNYSSDTFRGKREGNQLKASVKGISYFLRSGVELRYLTANGHLFFGTGLNRWNIENSVTIVESNLTIKPRLWADNTDTFFQAGAMFETGSGKAMIGARMSDLTHEINTQLVEFFAEVKIDFD